MKTILSSPRRLRAGFTLIELLVVIAIIAILAAMLLPVLIKGKIAAQKAKARTEISGLVTAIAGYDSAYGRFPVSPSAQAAATAANGDFTYGGTLRAANGSTMTVPTFTGYSYQANNAEVIAILMDITTVPVNANHQKNPQQTKFLNAKPVSDTSSPGVGTDLVYRDPWGNPYIISMDLNYDEACEDAFYCKQSVSGGGINGLIQQGASGSDHWAFHGKVMVWSAGPDGKIDAGAGANAGANKDNVLSWQ